MAELLGIAQGCVGMSREDFARCTPDEFQAIHDAWYNLEESHMRRLWEVGRMVAAFSLQPYSKKPVRSMDLCVFPWEKDEKTSASTGTSSEERAREILARLEKDSGVFFAPRIQEGAQFKQKDKK